MDGTASITKIGKMAFFSIDDNAHVSGLTRNTHNIVATLPVGYRPRSALRVQPLLSNGWGNVSATYPLQIIFDTNGNLDLVGAVDVSVSFGAYSNVSYPIP